MNMISLKGRTAMTTKHLLAASVASLTLTLAGTALVPVPADAAATTPPTSQSIAVRTGQVIALNDTPNLWVVDNQGVAHYASDPSALTGHVVDWSAVQPVTVVQLRDVPRGTPWLSASLVRIGDAIYLPTFGAEGGVPLLLHIKSTDDLTLLGVDADNYRQLVLDQSTWEQRYGFTTSTLRYDDFRLDGTPAVGPAAAPPATADDGETHTAAIQN